MPSPAFYGYSALSQLAAGIEQRQAEEKQRGQLAKVLRTKHGILNPEGKAAFDQMGYEELLGLDEAHTFEQAAQKERRNQAYVEAQIGQLQRAAQEQEIARGVPGRLMEQQENYAEHLPEHFDAHGFTPSLMDVVAAHQGGALPDEVMKEMVRGTPRGLQDLIQAGLVVDGGQLNPNGEASLLFGQPAPTPTPFAPPPDQYLDNTIYDPATGKTTQNWKTRAKPEPNDAQRSFLQNASELVAQLDILEDTVKQFGSAELLDPEASQALDGLGYSAAFLYAKMIDPATAAREGEVDAIQKRLFPLGWNTRNAKALAAIKNLKREAGRRIMANREQTTFTPPSLAPAFVSEYMSGAMKPGSKPAAASAPAEPIRLRTPDGRIWKLDPGKTNIDDALKAGFQVVPPLLKP